VEVQLHLQLVVLRHLPELVNLLGFVEFLDEPLNLQGEYGKVFLHLNHLLLYLHNNYNRDGHARIVLVHNGNKNYIRVEMGNTMLSLSMVVVDKVLDM
jgi:hypothetical protein